MFKDIKNIIDSCKICAKFHPCLDYCKLKTIKVIYFFKIVSLDTGFIPIGKDKNHYFILAINCYTQ